MLAQAKSLCYELNRSALLTNALEGLEEERQYARARVSCAN